MQSFGESNSCGVGLSGGGVPAIVSGMCLERGFETYLPGWNTRATVSTVSGGTAGHAIKSNADDKLEFPDLESGFALKLEQLEAPLDAPEGKVYFAQVNHLINSLGLETSAEVVW